MTPELKAKLEKLLSIFLSIAVLITIPCLLSHGISKTSNIELDRDEGINFIKAELISRGFDLYEDVWADQPPFFPTLLSGALEIFPRTLTTGRTLVAILSGFLLWALFETVSMRSGKLAGFLSVILYLSVVYVLRYAAIAMVGMPCHAFGMLGVLAMLVASSKSKPLFAAIAASFLVLSFSTKLYGLIFSIPMAVFFFEAKAEERRRLFLSGALGGILMLIYMYAVAPEIVYVLHTQLIGSHLGAQHLDVPHGWRRVHQIIRPELKTIYLAIIAALAFILRKQIKVIAPLLMAGVSLAFFIKHRPVWNHHAPLLFIPICWIAGEGIALIVKVTEELLRDQSRRKRIFGMLSATAVLCLLVPMFLEINKLKNRIRRIGFPLRSDIVSIIQSELADGGKLFTDRPMYAFLSDAEINPEYAVITAKRLRSGELLQGEVIEVLRKDPPELILLDRFPKLRQNILRASHERCRTLTSYGESQLLKCHQ